MRTRTKASIAVRLIWGDDVLCFRLLRPGQRFVVGGDAAGADFAAPAERRVVCVDRKGCVVLESPDGHRLIPMPARLDVPLGGELKLSIRSARDVSLRRSFAARSWLLDLAVVAGVASYVLMVIVVSFLAFDGSLGLEWESVERDSVVGDSFGQWSLEKTTLASTRSPDWRPMLRAEIVEPEANGYAIFPEAPAVERSREARLSGKHVPRRNADGRSGGTGARARLEEGPIGNPDAPEALGVWALAPAKEVKIPVPAREQRAWRRTYSNYWFASVGPADDDIWDRSGWHEDTSDDEIDAPFGDEESAGEDESDVTGNMFGADPVDPKGAGLGVRGSGPGGGGTRKNIGLGVRGALGHGAGRGRSQGVGVVDLSWFTRDSSLAAHHPRAPRLSTRVPDAVVERVLRQSAGRFQSCAHVSGPSAIDVSFAIGGVDGTTSAIVVQSDSVLLTACVKKVLGELRFHSRTSGSTPVTRRVRLR